MKTITILDDTDCYLWLEECESKSLPIRNNHEKMSDAPIPNIGMAKFQMPLFTSLLIPVLLFQLNFVFQNQSLAFLMTTFVDNALLESFEERCHNL